jgi:hypothetical protein
MTTPIKRSEERITLVLEHIQISHNQREPFDFKVTQKSLWGEMLEVPPENCIKAALFTGFPVEMIETMIKAGVQFNRSQLCHVFSVKAGDRPLIEKETRVFQVNPDPSLEATFLKIHTLLHIFLKAGAEFNSEIFEDLFRCTCATALKIKIFDSLVEIAQKRGVRIPENMVDLAILNGASFELVEYLFGRGFKISDATLDNAFWVNTSSEFKLKLYAAGARPSESTWEACLKGYKLDQDRIVNFKMLLEWGIPIPRGFLIRAYEKLMTPFECWKFLIDSGAPFSQEDLKKFLVCAWKGLVNYKRPNVVDPGLQHFTNCLDLLIKKGLLQLEWPDGQWQESPLYLTLSDQPFYAVANRVDIIRFYLDLGVRPTKSLILHELIGGDIEAVRLLLRSKTSELTREHLLELPRWGKGKDSEWIKEVLRLYEARKIRVSPESILIYMLEKYIQSNADCDFFEECLTLFSQIGFSLTEARLRATLVIAWEDGKINWANVGLLMGKQLLLPTKAFLRVAWEKDPNGRLGLRREIRYALQALDERGVVHPIEDTEHQMLLLSIEHEIKPLEIFRSLFMLLNFISILHPSRVPR